MFTLLHYVLGPLAYFHMEGEGGAPSGGTPTPTPSAAPGASPTPATPAPQPGTPAPGAPSTPAPAADDLQDGNWKQLRENLTAAQSKAALLDSLEGVTDADLPVAWKQFTAMRTEATTLGKALGYTDAELKEAIDADPVYALHQLRQAKADADAAARVTQKPGETQVDYEKRIQEEVAKQTKPFTDHINKQLSDAVQTRIGEEITKAYDVVLPNTPTEVRELVTDYVEEYIIHNPNLIVAMKARGDYKSVEEAVRVVAGRLQSVFTKWVAHETTRTGGRTSTGSPTAPNTVQQGKGTGPNGRVTLDDMIENPELIGAAYAKH